ncbi:MAG: hypothetical protein ACRDRG_06960 [Pseudonocardiaceae bacterium]
MDVRLHHDPAECAALRRPLLEADPVRHTVALTVINLLLRAPTAEDAPAFLTVHREQVLVGAAICTPPYPLIVSALPVSCVDAAVGVLTPGYPGLPGTRGAVHRSGEPDQQRDLPTDRLPPRTRHG